MNPHAPYQCAGRLLMALAAISSILLIAGCGSSNSVVPPNQVGFSASSLTGTYVFSATGVDSEEGAPIALAGALMANGTGGITGGTMDAVDPEIGVALNQSISGNSSYRVNSDGRGQATINAAGATFVLDFVLTSGSHGLVTEFDNIGTGSGTIDLQTALTGQSQLAGPYAFTLGGFDSEGDPLATVGAVTLDVNGNITAGVEDLNDDGGLITDQSVAGTVILGSGTAPGSITLTSSGQTFDLYPIDATHLKFIETDSVDFLAGDAFTQNGASIPAAAAFTMSGGQLSIVADAGVMTYDGTTFSGSEDINLNGNVFTESFTGNPGATGPVGGRVVVSLTGFEPASTWVIYPSGGGLLMMEVDTNAVTLGAAYTQTAGQTIEATENYGFNLNAWNTTGFQENDIAQFVTNSGNSGFAGAVDINDDFGPDGGDSLSQGQLLNGTYTLNSDGTGSATTTTTGNNAYFSFNFYPASSDTLLVLETDSNQIGAGIFELQSPPSGSVAQSHISLARPAVLRPAVRSRLASRHKNNKNKK